MYLLDTSICAYIINRRPAHARERLAQRSPDGIGVSSLTIAELRYGADRSLRPAQNHESLNAFLLPLGVYDSGAEAASVYGMIRIELERRGTPSARSTPLSPRTP